MRVVLSFVLLVSLVCVGSVNCHADSVDRIIAVVNGEIILYSELGDRIRVLHAVAPDSKSDDSARNAQIEREVLQQMVREKLVEQEAKRMKITVSKRDVDDAIEDIKRENKVTDAQIEGTLKQNNQTVNEFRESLRKDIERDRLIDRALKSKIVITDQQIDALLRQSGVQLSPLPQPAQPAKAAGGSTGPESYRLAIIFLPDAQGAHAKEAEKLGKDILDKLKGGTDFGQLVRQYSKGPAVDQGGDVGFMSAEELAPYLQKAITGVGKGQLSGVTKGQGGYYIVKVVDVRKGGESAPQVPETVRTGGTGDSKDPGLREKARRQLYQQEMNRRFDEWVRDLESRSFIKISL